MIRQLLGQFGKFAIVGVIGFIVDFGLTLLLVHFGVDALLARLFALATAMVTTWRLNRAMTFGASNTSQTSEGLRYFIVAITVASVNYAIYAGLLLSIESLTPLMALLISSAFANSLSFLGYRYFAFKRDV